MASNNLIPLDSASLYYSENYKSLVYLKGNFYKYTGASYEVETREKLISSIYRFHQNQYLNRLQKKPANKKDVLEILEALKADRLIESKEQKFWIKSVGLPNASQIIAFKNGLLNLEDKSFIHPTSNFFCENYINIEYRNSSQEPINFLKFLQTIWPNDLDSISTLQEIMGLLLTDITDFQKIFLLVGPPRSGKGTLIKVIQELVGQNNYTSPTLNSLSTHFGLKDLIGKLLAIVTDARISAKTEISILIEVLLRVSGQDSISIPRKYLDDWTGRLNTRFLICSNELPSLYDASNAIANRFIILQMTESFLGKENLNLFEELKSELPQILNWSLLGLDRLLARGKFLQPASGQDSVDALKRVGSPIENFIDDICIVEKNGTVVCSELFNRWKNWCEEHNFQHAGTSQSFGKIIKSALPQISTKQNTEPRYRYYEGLRLRPELLLVKRDNAQI